MGKSRTLKFLIDKGILGVGDAFKYSDFVDNVIIDDISDERVFTKKGAFVLSDKVYPLPKEKKIESQTITTKQQNPLEFTISFSCKTDFEYVDKESKTMEEALEKARTMTPWQLILKSEPVDVQDKEVNIFGLISNEL